MSQQPVDVTIAIPMRNEQHRIAACLESVRANVLPGRTFECLVLDGRSTDDSCAVVRAIAEMDPRIRLLDNPAGLQAAAFNLALREARGTWFVRMDAHSEYAPDYVAECVRLLEETGAGNVGGVQRAEGSSAVGRAIAAAVSSPFAAGDARYRHARTPGWVDTVYLGAWRTETLRALGGMREDLAVNEDYELNVRLRASGKGVYLSPTIRSRYHVRGSLGRLARQYARYGFWKVRTLIDHPRSLRVRQLVAPAFVASILATPFLTSRLGAWGASHLALYAAANAAASVQVASRHGWALLTRLPLVFLTIHGSWGAGFLGGLIAWPARLAARRR